MKIKPESCCEKGQELAESLVNAFSAVLYRRSQSTDDESRLKLGQCRRRDAPRFWADECGKVSSALVQSENIKVLSRYISLPFRMCLHIFAAIWQSQN